MKEIHVNFIKDLRNFEFVELYNLIIDYTEKQQVDDINIKTAFKQVASHRIKLNGMRMRKPSKFSIENNELKRIRNDYLISLRLRVQSFLLSQSKAERDAASEIQYAIKPYGREFYVSSILPQTRFAKNLKERLKQNKKFRDAVLYLRLDDLLNAIIDMTADIMENYNQRITKNKVTKNKRAGVKDAAYRDMKIMADVINFTAVMDRRNQVKESVAEEYIFFINAILSDFHTMLKSRNTKSKNRKAVEVAVHELVRSQKEEVKLLPLAEVDVESDPSTG